MTRRHFIDLAWNLRHVYPEPGELESDDLGSDWYAGQVRAWENAVFAVAKSCRNANPNFAYEKFYEAAGLRRRSDGSMYPMSPPAR